MIKAHPITRENVEHLQGIYNRFSLRAKPDYRWTHDPVAFDVLKIAIGNGVIKGYWVEETSVSEPVAFMLYYLEEYRSIEVNVIYSEIEDRKTVLDRLMRKFIEDVRDTQGWDVISYAMMGEQEAFIRSITWYGFKPIGQAILNFDMLDAVSVQILKQQHPEPLPAEYRLDTWRPEYAAEVAQCVYEAFSEAADAKWDPRFRTLMGAKKVVGMITGGMMGPHIPACTSVMLKNDVPVGFCFLIQGDALAGNIPLIGVKPAEKGQKLGNRMLQATLNQCIDEMIGGRIAMISVNTTTDTDNLAAMKMYRRMGFRDDYNYPHVYLPQEELKVMKVGQWC